MDIIRFLVDHRIPFQTEGHKHCRPGWVNMGCPFCVGNEGLHLGYDMAADYFCCWRCGGKPLVKTLAKISHLSEAEVRNILPSYGGRSRRVKAPEAKILFSPFKHPSGTGIINERHIYYLMKRGFDPYEIQGRWNILGTGPIALLRTSKGFLNYSHRIVIPIYWAGQEVSFQARDITGRHELRYIACPEEREQIKHKHVLYGTSERLQAEEALVVEGVTDAWRFKGKAVATFGIKYTPIQMRLLARTYKRVAIVFDDDPQAITQAEKLAGELRFRGVKAEVVKIEGDPGDMSDAEAHRLVERIGI